MKWFVFDLDGTLIDTDRAVRSTWLYTLQEFGISLTQDKLDGVLGVTTDIGLQNLQVQLDPYIFGEAWKKHYQLFAGEMVFYEGVEKMLFSLHDLNIGLGVVSSRSMMEYKDYFAPFALDRFFDTIVLEDHTEQHKPFKDPLEYFMKQVNARSSQVIYIGDQKTDIECAHHAKVTAGLVSWNQMEVIFPEADIIFANPQDVVSYGKRLLIEKN